MRRLQRGVSGGTTLESLAQACGVRVICAGRLGFYEFFKRELILGREPS